MDPPSTVGLTASTLNLTRLLGQGVLSAKIMLNGIRDVYENARGFREELDTFHFSLSVLDFGIRKGSMVPEIQGRWGMEQLNALLENARSTFSRLESILHDIHKDRSVLQRTREHIRTNTYNQEISHLRLRINTYISALNIPVVLSAIYGAAGSSIQMDQNWNLGLLDDRISQLEEGISNISNCTNARAATNESTGSPRVELPIYQESKELVEIARTLASNASSVGATEGPQSTLPTVRAPDAALPLENARATSRQDNSGVTEYADTNDSRRDASGSVIGVPLAAQRRARIESWILPPQTTRSPDPIPEDFSVSDIASINPRETSKFSDALYTPPSTVHNREASDIEMLLVKRRYERAKYLMEQKKYREAIPHLRRTLDAIETAGESLCLQDARSYQKVQFLLATALIDTRSNMAEAEAVVRDLLESPESELSERHSAAHLLAQLYLYQHPNDCTRAKTACLIAVKGRSAALGNTHPKTYESIALLCSICQASNDSDEEIWREMLPESLQKQYSKIRASPALTLVSHPSGASAVAFSPDGKLIAYIALKGECGLWDVATGAVRQGKTGYPGVTFLPDGELVATGVMAWYNFDTAFHARLRSLKFGKFAGPLSIPPSDSIVFSPDITLLKQDKLPKEYNNLTLSDITGGERRLLHSRKIKQVAAIAFSPNGTMVAYSDGLDVKLYDVAGYIRHALVGHSGAVTAATFSPDGNIVASASEDKTIKLWDVTTGAAHWTLMGHLGPVTAVTFSPDCQLIASGSRDHTVRIWDFVTGAKDCTLTGHSDRVLDVAFSPDGKTVASGSLDGTVKLWVIR